MNTHVITLFNELALQNMRNFSRLPLVKSLICSDNIVALTQELKGISDFYQVFLQKIGLLPGNIEYYRRSISGTYEYFRSLRNTDQMVKEVLYCFPKKELQVEESIIPIHVRYYDSSHLYLASGMSWTENSKKVLMHLSEYSLPKDMVAMPPPNLSYLVDLLNEYNPSEIPSVRDLASIKGINYNRLQSDCKAYWEETFYRFFNKIKMVQAVGDIIYTRFTMKEIAFRNKFSGYINMHRTFLSYGVSLNDIPRLANH